MEGQFGDTTFSNMYSNAGVVPRAVEHVFKYLEENDLEYQVWKNMGKDIPLDSKHSLACFLNLNRSGPVISSRALQRRIVGLDRGC